MVSVEMRGKTTNLLTWYFRCELSGWIWKISTTELEPKKNYICFRPNVAENEFQEYSPLARVMTSNLFSVVISLTFTYVIDSLENTQCWGNSWYFFHTP